MTNTIEGTRPVAMKVEAGLERSILKRSRLKHRLYERLTGLSIVLLSAGVISVVAFATVGAAVLTGTLGFLYFVNQHRLNETRLFLDLFRDFNQRYDKLGDDLHRILQRESSEALSPADKGTLVSYFNLCGEEFLMFRQGYIHPDAWTAWRRGMDDVFTHPAIRAYWGVESRLASYYGLENLYAVDDAAQQAVAADGRPQTADRR